MTTQLTRRRLIALSGAVGLTALAGCGNDSVDEGPGPQAPTDEESETPEDEVNDTEGAFQDNDSDAAGNETESGNGTIDGNETEGGNGTIDGNETGGGNETENGNETGAENDTEGGNETEE